MKHASPLLDALWSEARSFSGYEAFLDLVNLAARRATAMKVGRARVLLERGELVTSTYALADRWRWSQKAVRNFLARLRAAGEILGTNLNTTKQGAGLKLTLCNFDSYTPPGLKRTQVETQGKSKQENGIGEIGNHVGTRRPPHTPPVVRTPLGIQASTTPTGGVGVGVASARDVENGTACGDLALEPSSSQLEIPPAENPEHLHYAEELADALNQGQAGNGHVDRDTYRPVAAHHRGTLTAALAIKNAGVPLLWATQYVRVEGQRYKPRPGVPQIHSLAYLERGCISGWRVVEAKRRLEQQQRIPLTRAEELPTRGGKPQLLGNLVGDLVARAGGGR